MKSYIMYKTSDGRYHDDEKSANIHQNKLNRKNLKSYRIEQYNAMLDRLSEKNDIWKNIKNNKYDSSDSNEIILKVFTNYNRDLMLLATNNAHEAGELPIEGPGLIAKPKIVE